MLSPLPPSLLAPSIYRGKNSNNVTASFREKGREKRVVSYLYFHCVSIFTFCVFLVCRALGTSTILSQKDYASLDQLIVHLEIYATRLYT
jgi:hypothetical protein